MKPHHEILAKILCWAQENSIVVTIGYQKEEGCKDRTEIILQKNGAKELIQIIDIEELERPLIQNLIKDRAFNLCLTRLEL